MSQKRIFNGECFTSYEECLKKIGLNSTGKKAEEHDYYLATRGNKNEKKNYLNDKYNLDHSSLEPLKSFLETHLK